jgi:hypothetical protein
MLTPTKYGEPEMKSAGVQRPRLNSGWQQFTNYVEEQRLVLLEARISRRKRILADDIAERRTIMMRAIRRMRRARGLD